MAYKIQIDDEVREATAEEAAVIDAQRSAGEQLLAEQAAALEARKAPLRRIGLTDDEIAIVLGL